MSLPVMTSDSFVSLDAVFWLVAQPLLLMHFNCFSGRFWMSLFFTFLFSLFLPPFFFLIMFPALVFVCFFSLVFFLVCRFLCWKSIRLFCGMLEKGSGKENVRWSTLNYKSCVFVDRLPYKSPYIVISPEAGESWATRSLRDHGTFPSPRL